MGPIGFLIAKAFFSSVLLHAFHMVVLSSSHKNNIRCSSEFHGKMKTIPPSHQNISRIDTTHFPSMALRVERILCNAFLSLLSQEEKGSSADWLGFYAHFLLLGSEQNWSEVGHKRVGGPRRTSRERESGKNTRQGRNREKKNLGRENRIQLWRKRVAVEAKKVENDASSSVLLQKPNQRHDRPDLTYKKIITFLDTLQL